MDNNPNRVYKLPVEITAETRMKGVVPITFIIVIALMLFLAQRFEGLVFEPLKYAWYIYNIAIGFVLCIKTQRNGEKRIVQSILLFLTKDRNTYMPIDNPLDYSDMAVPKTDE